MPEIVSILVQSLTKAPIFLSLVALAGLLLQRKKPHEILNGVIQTLVGMTMLSIGSDQLTSTLTPVILKLNEVTGVSGVVPQNFSVYGTMLSEYATAVVLAFLLGFVINLLLVKIVPWDQCKNVYLTVHVALILSSFLCASLSAAFGWEIVSVPTIVCAGVLLGLYNTFSPAVARLYTKDLTGGNYTLGHQLQIGTGLGVLLAKAVGDPEQDADKIKLPKGLDVLKNVTVAMAILMPLIFIGMGIAIGQAGIDEISDGTFWIVWLLLQGIYFTAGFTVLLAGVRMFINQLLPAFKGIADKFAKGSIPALDCAVFYPFSGTGAMLGFVSAAVGALAAMMITIVFQLPVVVFPSPNVVVFDGMTLGVFGNKYGGWKGSVVAGFTIVFLVHMLIIFLYPLTGVLYGGGLTYSQTDYSIFWMPVMTILSTIGHALGLS